MIRRLLFPTLSAAAALSVLAFCPTRCPAQQLGSVIVSPVKVTPAQKTKLDALRAALAQKINSIAAQKNLTKVEREALVKKVAAKYLADVSAVYTPAQRAQMADEGKLAREAWMEQHQETKEADAREAEFNRLKKEALMIGAELDKELTPGQKSKISQAQADAKQQSDAATADKTLSDDQREQKLKGIEGQLESSVNGIFTTDTERTQFSRLLQILDRQTQLLVGSEASPTPTAPAKPSATVKHSTANHPSAGSPAH